MSFELPNDERPISYTEVYFNAIIAKYTSLVFLY